jgi:hypothetical protein
MKTILTAMVALWLSGSPSTGTDLSKVPQATLMEGLHMVSVCLVIDSTAADALNRLVHVEYAANRTENSSQARRDADQFEKSFEEYGMVGASIINALSKTYHVDAQAIANTSREDLIAVKANMGDMAEVKTYLDFMKIFPTHLKKCTALSEKFKKSLQVAVKTLEQ